MRSILRWLFPPRSLEGVTAPTRVRVDGTLLNPDDQVSPMTGRRAALFRYGFWERAPQLGGQYTVSGRTKWTRDLLLMGRVGDALHVQVEDRVVLVPVVERVGLDLLGTYDPAPVNERLPDAITVAHPELEDARGELCFDELALHTGQRVRIHGVLAPVQRARPAVFRGGSGGPGWDFVAQPEEPPFRIEELRSNWA